MTEPDTSAYKEAIAAVFTATSASHDTVGTVFSHFGSLLADRVDLQVGDRVLDVAAGTGATLFPAARRIAGQGRVVAIDLAPGMVDQLSAAIAAGGLTNAEALVADAEDLPFSDESFDAVLCGFALFFFPDTTRALREFRRVLRGAGRLALSTFTREGSASIAGVWERLAPFVAPPQPLATTWTSMSRRSCTRRWKQRASPTSSWRCLPSSWCSPTSTLGGPGS